MDVKKRMRELLLEDLKRDEPPRWWYISIAGDTGFIGGYFIKANGPHHAWTLLHRLGWFPYEDKTAETLTIYVPDDRQSKVTPQYQWRKLSKTELEAMK